jgi:hypothetical protein
MVKTIHRLITETIMTRMEILQRLQTIKNKGTQALKLLESKPLTVDAQAEIRSLAQWIKDLHQRSRFCQDKSCEVYDHT